MVALHNIDLIEVEAAMDPSNRRHVPLGEFTGYLHPLGYSLFHLYHLTPDTKFSGLANLRRCNAVFASHTLLAKNRVIR